MSSYAENLVEQIRQHRRIAAMTCGDLDHPNLQRLFVDPEVDLAPDQPFRAAMLAGAQLGFTLRLDLCGAISRCSGPLELR